MYFTMQIFTFNRNLLSNNSCNATYFQQENTVSELRTEKQKKEGELCTCIKINLICVVSYVNRFIFSLFYMYITFQYVHSFVYLFYFCVRPSLFSALFVFLLFNILRNLIVTKQTLYFLQLV